MHSANNLFSIFQVMKTSESKVLEPHQLHIPHHGSCVLLSSRYLYLHCIDVVIKQSLSLITRECVWVKLLYIQNSPPGLSVSSFQRVFLRGGEKQPISISIGNYKGSEGYLDRRGWAGSLFTARWRETTSKQKWTTACRQTMGFSHFKNKYILLEVKETTDCRVSSVMPVFQTPDFTHFLRALNSRVQMILSSTETFLLENFPTSLSKPCGLKKKGVTFWLENFFKIKQCQFFSITSE